MTIPAYIVWVIVAFLALSALGQIALIGEPRTPITRGQAAWNALWCCALIVTMALWVTG